MIMQKSQIRKFRFSSTLTKISRNEYRIEVAFEDFQFLEAGDL